METMSNAAPAPRRQPGGRALRRRRILLRMREGWAYEEIARAEKVTVVRIRKIVAEMLKKREIDDPSDHARLQLARLESALQSAGEAVAAGDIKAIGPFLRVLDRVDHYRGVAAMRQFEGSYHRERLLAKLNRMAEAIEEEKEEKAEAARRAAGLADEPTGEDNRAPVEANERELEVAKFFPRNFGRPL
jgi:hypothetical protein